MKQKRPKNISLVLHNIRSLHNVGSIFRTADGVGVSRIFLTGYTGKPTDRFGKIRQEIHKTALGAEKEVSWKYCKNLSQLINKLRREKVFVLALEQSPQATDYRKFFTTVNYSKKLINFFEIVLLVGNEVRGLSSSILKKCDAVIEIPMRGKKESLNVAVATGIALFKLREDF